MYCPVLCMVLSLLPSFALAEGETSFTGGLTAEVMSWTYSDESYDVLWIFAHGKAITIEAKGTGTVIKAADADNNGAMTEIDLATLTTGLKKADDTSLALTTDGDNGYNLSAAVICGGSNGNLGQNAYPTPITVDTSITMNGGTVGALVGGCRAGKLIGSTNLTVTGGTLNGPYVTDLSSEGRRALVGGSVSTNSYYGVVTGDVRVTITGGTIQNYCLLGSVGRNTSSTQAGVNNAYLSITGSPNFLNDEYSLSFYAVTYSTITGSAYYYVAPTSGQMPSFQLDYNYGTIGGANILTNCKDKFDSKFTGHYITIDDTNKIYGLTDVDSSFTLGMNYTIPEGYTMTIPADVTLTVPAGVTITNNGAISIKGTLTNSGTISGGTIVKVGTGSYTGGTPATGDVLSSVEPFTGLTIAAGADPGTTKIAAVDAAAADNKQYYKYLYGFEPDAPKVGDKLANTSGYTELTAQTGDIPAVVGKSYLIVCELDRNNTYVKYDCVPLTSSNIQVATLTDLSSAVSGGDDDNTTKITATAGNGNKLYYTFSDTSTVGLYNQPINTGSLPDVTSGADISAEAGKYLVVYELNSDGLLRGFACVQMDTAHFTGYTGGLVADTTNKIIYCNGKTVCMSAKDAGHGDITAPQLYVLDGTAWNAATPKNLTFSNGQNYADYTLKGGANAEDTTAKGTLYLLSTDKVWEGSERSWTFRSCLPKAAEGFANFIVPALGTDSNTDSNWDKKYTVGGTIDLSQARLTHLISGKRIDMSALTINDGGSLTFPTGNPTVYFSGKASDIVRTGTGSTTNVFNVIFTPQVDVKLYDKNNVEFTKEDGIYQVPNDEQVTIVAVLSTGGGAAGAPSGTQTPVSATPSTTEPASVTSKPSLGTYAIAFQTPLENSNCMYTYYADNKLQIAYSGESGESAVTTLTLTLSAEAFAAQSGNKLCVLNSEITSGSNQPPQYAYNMMTMSFAITKIRQKTALTITDKPDAVTYGGADFTLKTSGGNGNGAVTWSSSDTAVATVGADTGVVTVLKAGATTITATKAGDDTYLPAEATYALTVNKKAPTAADFAMTPATNLVWNGDGKTATVTENGVTGMGAISAIYYTGISPTTYAKSETAPTNAGTYSVSIDVDAGDNYAAATGIAVGQFTITKAENIDAPTNDVADDTANTLTFTKTSGYNDYQFSIDGGTTWADCVDTDEDDATITINVGNIAGTVKVRVKETENVVGISLESTAFTASLEGSVSISGTAKYGETLTAVVTGAQANAVLTYQWKLAGSNISGATASTYVISGNVIGKTISVTVSASPYMGELNSAATAAVLKGDPKGTPSYTTIASSGKTLADAALAIGTITPNTEGYSLKWVDKDGNELENDTAVAANTAYKWLFTPKDTANYNTLTGSITLYTVSTGGGGGGGAAAPTVPTVEAPVTEGGTTTVTSEVKPNVSGGTAKAEIPTATVDKAVETAVEAAKTGETEIVIEISVKPASEATTRVETILPAAAVSKIAESKAALSVTTGVAAVELPAAAVAAIAEQTGGRELSLTIEAARPEDLTPAQQNALGKSTKSAVIVDLSLSIGSGKVSNLGGTATIAVPCPGITAEKAERMKAWYVADDGTITPCEGSYYVKDGKFTFQTNHFSTYALVEFPFEDVPDSAWYYGDVAYAYMNELFSGTGDTTFEPETAMTRAMLVTVLWRMEKEPVVNYLMPFTDVDEGQWYGEAVRWAASEKLVNGTTETTFAPNNTLTREQLATIMYNYAVYKKLDVSVGENTNILSYNDAFSISQYAIAPIQWACGAGLVNGANGNLMPQGSATRAQVAAILHRFCNAFVK